MDTGFPQIGRGSAIGSPNKLVWRCGDRAYVPTLEELIEACGDEFGHVARLHGGKHWRASGRDNDEEYSLIEELGATPTEAVARLWLALNKQ